MSVVVAFILLSLTQAGPNQATNPSTGSRDERDAQLQFMVRTLDEFKLAPRDAADRPFQRTPEPVLRYSNAVRGNQLTDGCVLVWLDGNRPVAVASMSIRREGQVWREFTSLVDRPLACSRDGQRVWSPASGGLLRQSIDDAPAPSDVARLRLVQMRQLAKRFRATYFKADGSDPTESRLMPQPVFRFEDQASKVVDGAIFAFAEGNDPELVLLIEAVGTGGDKIVWRYSLARMTSSPLTVRLDEREVWSVTAYWRSPRSPEDPYVEATVTKLPEGDAAPPED
jgi:hypothetical protein